MAKEEEKTVEQLIEELNETNKEIGDPPLMAMGPNGMMDASTMIKMQAHAQHLAQHNEEFQGLLLERQEVDQKLDKIFQETFNLGEKPVT